MVNIVDVLWERANIHLYFNKLDKNSTFYLEDKKRKIIIDDIKENEAVINITNLDGKMLDAGNWKLFVDDKPVKFSYELIKKINDYSRIFKYRNGVYSTQVEFAINDELETFLIVDYMMKNRKYKKFLRVSEEKNISKKLFVLLKMIAIVFLNFLSMVFRLFKKNRILILSENSDSLTSNLKSVKEAFDKKKIKTTVFTKNQFNDRKNIISYIKEIYYIATSKTIIIDNYTKILNILNVKAKIIQLWHAGLGFKAVGYARFGGNGSPHPYHSSHRKYDIAIVDNEKLIPIYKEVFGITEDKFRSCGLPRLDNYLNLDNINKVVDELSEINSKVLDHKVILFAPTYRGNGQEDATYDYEKIDFKALYSFLKKEGFIFIIKMHPFIKNNIEIKKEYRDLIYDYSELDINDLIYVSDIMITDYSSCAYEYSMFNRPLIFYRYDKEVYEYLRPKHTLDIFCSKQFEATNFLELMKILEMNKNIDIKMRFEGIKDGRNSNSCDIIIKEAI